MCKGLLSKCCFVFHELSYTDVVFRVYYTIMSSLSEKAKTRLAPSANYFLKNPFAHHQTHDGSQDDSSFTFLDLSRLQSSPTTSLAAPSQWATKLLNIKLYWFLKVEKLFAITLKELKEFRIVLLFLSNPKIINNHINRMKVFSNQVI